MKTYVATRHDVGNVTVRVGGKPLPLRLDLINHSPGGFEWGYGGSGPGQLALAILADCCGDEYALKYYQDFKRDFIAGLVNDFWTITEPMIKEWQHQKQIG